MATITGHLRHREDFPLSAADALTEARMLVRYALEMLDGSEHTGVLCHARAAVCQLDGSLAAIRGSGRPDRISC